MNLKQLTKQHDDFAAAQARKAERARLKAEKETRWTLMKETQRKTRERKARASDAAQQRRLEDADAVYVPSRGD
jgi:hypothetical protein